MRARRRSARRASGRQAGDRRHGPRVGPSPTQSESPVQIETRLIPAASDGPRENVGITRLTARPLPNSPETDEVLVEVENFGAQRQTGNVELSFEGQLLDVKPFDLAPGERRTDIYPTLGARARIANPRGWLTAHLDLPADAYAPDDDAYAVVPPPRPMRVLLVTKGNWFLESLLKADDRVEFDQLDPGAFQPAQAAGFDAVVLDDFVFDTGSVDSLPKGNFLFLGKAPSFDGNTTANAASTTLEHPPITDVDAGNPLLYLLNLRDVTILRAHAWQLPEIAADTANAWRFTAPVRSLDRPLLVTGERKGQRMVAVAFGAADSDLPLRVAFPLLIHNALGFLAGRDEAADAAGRSVRAGETITLGPGEIVSGTGRRRSTDRCLPEASRRPNVCRGPGCSSRSATAYYLRHGADGSDTWLAVNTGRPGDVGVECAGDGQFIGKSRLRRPARVSPVGGKRPGSGRRGCIWRWPPSRCARWSGGASTGGARNDPEGRCRATAPSARPASLFAESIHLGSRLCPWN